jgi:hypothetical protein
MALGSKPAPETAYVRCGLNLAVPSRLPERPESGRYSLGARYPDAAWTALR